MKAFSVLILSLFLVSCALPTSEMDLINIGRVEEVCHQESLQATIDKLYPKIMACYNYDRTVPDLSLIHI